MWLVIINTSSRLSDNDRVRQEGAAGNADVTRDLVPLLASTSSTMDRVFPDDQISEVREREREVKNFLKLNILCCC